MKGMFYFCEVNFGPLPEFKSSDCNGNSEKQVLKLYSRESILCDLFALQISNETFFFKILSFAFFIRYFVINLIHFCVFLPYVEYIS